MTTYGFFFFVNYFKNFSQNINRQFYPNLEQCQHPDILSQACILLRIIYEALQLETNSHRNISSAQQNTLSYFRQNYNFRPGFLVSSSIFIVYLFSSLYITVFGKWNNSTEMKQIKAKARLTGLLAIATMVSQQNKF